MGSNDVSADFGWGMLTPASSVERAEGQGAPSESLAQGRRRGRGQADGANGAEEQHPGGAEHQVDRFA